MAGIFGEFFWSPFPTKRSTKILEKFGANSEQNSGQNPGRKFQKFGKPSFCNFSDLTKCKSRVLPEVSQQNRLQLAELSQVHRGVHLHTPNRAPVDLWWPNSIWSKPSHMSFNLFHCFCGTTLQSTSSENLPLEKRTIFQWKFNMSSTTREEVQMVQDWRFFRWIFGPKSAGVYLFFSCGKQHCFADAAGLTGLVLLILSVLSPFDSTNHKQSLLWGKACCTPVFGPPVPLEDFAISRFVVSFFGPESKKWQHFRSFHWPTRTIFWMPRFSMAPSITTWHYILWFRTTRNF